MLQRQNLLTSPFVLHSSGFHRYSFRKRLTGTQNDRTCYKVITAISCSTIHRNNRPTCMRQAILVRWSPSSRTTILGIKNAWKQSNSLERSFGRRPSSQIPTSLTTEAVRYTRGFIDALPLESTIPLIPL